MNESDNNILLVCVLVVLLMVGGGIFLLVSHGESPADQLEPGPGFTADEIAAIIAAANDDDSATGAGSPQSAFAADGLSGGAGAESAARGAASHPENAVNMGISGGLTTAGEGGHEISAFAEADSEARPAADNADNAGQGGALSPSGDDFPADRAAFVEQIIAGRAALTSGQKEAAADIIDRLEELYDQYAPRIQKERQAQLDAYAEAYRLNVTPQQAADLELHWLQYRSSAMLPYLEARIKLTRELLPLLDEHRRSIFNADLHRLEVQRLQYQKAVEGEVMR